jgi:hypothetical protein
MCEHRVEQCIVWNSQVEEAQIFSWRLGRAQRGAWGDAGGREEPQQMRTRPAGLTYSITTGVAPDASMIDRTLRDVAQSGLWWMTS